MSRLSRGLVDTSVLIAAEVGRRVERTELPEETAVSVVTLAELQAGVLAAPDSGTRARRMETLDRLSHVLVVGVDEGAAMEWARLRVHLAEQGRHVNVNDLWIAASAVQHRLPIVTQDDDFDPLEGVRGLAVVKV